MAKLKERIESTPLNQLRQQLSTEITDTGATDDKLKLLLAMLHVTEESLKLIDTITTDGFLTELQTKVNNLHDKFENYRALLKLEADQDKAVLEALEGSNTELQTLQDEITSRLEKMQKLLKVLVNKRNDMSLPLRELNKKRGGKNAGV